MVRKPARRSKPRRAPKPTPARARRGQGAWEGPIVAMGSSAGGLASLQVVLGGLPKEFRAPILIVQHMDPAHASSLAALLQGKTRLSVRAAKHGEPLAPGVVLVAAPDHHLEVQGGRVRLTRGTKRHHARPSVDVLFESAAREAGERVTAVVLSGAGSDGAEGALQVKDTNGTVVAEDSTTAAYPAMPEAAARTGAVDAVLPVHEIPAFLVKSVRGDRAAISTSDWDALLRLLLRRFNIDFRGYKTSTLHRSLQRRLSATGQTTLGAYLAFAETHPDELDKLRSAFLVKVSAFYRDPEAWKDLQAQVVRPLARAKGPLRAWCAGCSTGEEAYSLAMLLLDALPPEARQGLKLFATDVDDQALDVARRGVYTAEQLESLPAEQRKRYFAEENGMFRASKELRRHIIFGVHDLTRDPPIAGLDLLVCRNVLIYIDPPIKKDIHRRLAYAVKPGGFLFLGKSEGIQELGDRFEPVARGSRSRLFRKVPAGYARSAHPPAPPRARRRGPLEEAVQEGGRQMAEEEAFRHMLLQSTSMPFVILDAQRRVTLWNRAAEHLFKVRAPRALGRHMTALAPGLESDRLWKALGRLESGKRTVSLRGVPWRSGYLDVECARVDGRMLLVCTDATARHAALARQREALRKARDAAREADRARENLAAANEELETLNEELQSANEEQQTLNEELESANEELETLNEELQSSNEEMLELNDELRAGRDAADRLGVFLKGVLDAVPDSAVVCDAEGKVTFWGRSASRLFGASEDQAVGKALLDVVPALATPEVKEAASAALRERRAVLVEDVPWEGNVHLRVSVAPAERAGRPEGFILVATDVTQRWRGEDAVRAAAEEDLLRANEQLRRANEQLRQVDERKTEFMNAVAHELRTPLTPIMMQLEFLRTAPANEKQRRSFDILGRSMNRLNGLVEQLLSVARLERGTRRPAKPVDLSAVVEDATEIFSDLAHQAGLSLETHVDKPLRVEADADGLTQVVTNLMSNALKFTPRGGRLAVRAFEQAGQCVVSVEDSGLGLTPEQARRVFEPFVQLHRDTHPSGSGLGLFISKGIVEEYGGKLWVESPGPGRGATFSFSLPAGKRARAAGQAAQREGS